VDVHPRPHHALNSSFIRSAFYARTFGKQSELQKQFTSIIH